MPDRALAAALARALEGEPTPDGEAADLARALRSAADAARTPVTADELERALGSLHGRLTAPHRRRRRIAVAVAGLAVAAALAAALLLTGGGAGDRKSTRLNSSHPSISYAVFCLKKKT